MSNLKDQLSELSPAELARLMARLAERRATAAASSAAPARAGGAAPGRIPRASASENGYPVSFIQERIWFLTQLDPATPAFTRSPSLKLRGHLDRTALQRAIDQLVERHESLRCNFVVRDGTVRQIVRPPTPIPLVEIGVAQASGASEEEICRREIAARAIERFDLENEWLVRPFLFRLGPDRHIVTFLLHHLISDGWSDAIMLRDLSALYRAAMSGVSTGLNPLPIQYPDYAAWQRDPVQAALALKSLPFWREYLRGDLPVLDLGPRPAAPATGVESRVPIAIQEPLLRDLRELCRASGCTPYMALLAVFKVLLARYSGEHDIVVGTPVAGRSDKALEELIGCFVNTVAVRTQIDLRSSFTDLLGAVRQQALDALSHGDTPFEKIVEAIAPVRDFSRQPLIQVLFGYHNVPFSAPSFPGAEAAPVQLAAAPSQFDLTISLVELGDRVAGSLEYRPDRIGRETAEVLADHYVNLLRNALARPSEQVGRLRLDPGGAAGGSPRFSFVSGNEPALGLGTFLDAVARRAREAPDATAIISGQASVSFSALVERTEAVAHGLRARGIRRGDCVGVFCDRSVDLVLSLLGIMRAGAAYVPLDPVFPPERLRHILEDSRPALVIANRAVGAALSSFPSDRVVAFEEIERARPLDAAAESEPPAPDDLAYVLYTSGSTGRPKGVEVKHRSLLNLLDSMARAPGCSARDTLLAVTTVSFDIAGLELFLPLTTGARLVVAAGDEARDPYALMRLIERHGVTLMQATPSLWTSLVEAGWTGWPTLCALCGGEPMTETVASALLRRVKALWNMYGPTETTIWSTCARIQVAAPALPVGTPIEHTQVVVLDELGQVVPRGCIGEIAIGGEGLARGYRGRPDLTAERFVHLSDAPGYGRRVYRTGDLGRIHADGTLYCLGRRDDQVKIRGYRVELGDIESALTAQHEISAAKVVALPRGNGKSLIAYVIPLSGSAIHESAIRARLRTILPEYMVPAHVVALPAFPLLPNGKIDKHALPVPARSEARGGEREALASATEREVGAAFAEVLGAGEIGPSTSFFDAGGHSLLAVRLIAKLATRFGVELPLASIFVDPTVRGISAVLDGHAGSPVERLRAVMSRDLVLPAELTVNAGKPAAPAGRVTFMTGATGFVGAFLLRELLARGTPRVACLVRAKSPQAGIARIRSAFEKYRLSAERLDEAVEVIPGELSQPRFGLAPDAFAKLGASLTDIFHCGANVNFVLPYAALRGTNVAGLLTVLSLAAAKENEPTPIQHVSTAYVFPSAAYPPGALIREDAPLVSGELLPMGYTQSKWVCEKLIASARSRGFSVNVFRLGRVSGDSTTGAGNQNDFLWTLVKLSLGVRCLPAVDPSLDLVPVDWVSRALVEIATRRPRGNLEYHLAHPAPITLRSVVDRLLAAYPHLDVVDSQEWAHRLRATSGALDDGAAGMALLFGGREGAEEGAQTAAQVFDIERTRTALAETAVRCPTVDGALVDKYLAFFREIGFLPAGRSE